MSERRSKRKEVPSSECDAEDRSAAYDTQSTKKTRKREATEQKNEGTARATSRDGKRKMDKDQTREDEGEELKAEASTPEGRKKRVRTTGLVNHRINNALLERARLIERDVLPAVDLHYVIDRRLNKTDIEWKLRSTAIGPGAHRLECRLCNAHMLAFLFVQASSCSVRMGWVRSTDKSCWMM
jgi:hypothetical protein